MMTTEAPEGMSTTNGKNRWFQLGLVSAGAAAPLIARWRSLRAAEQAEALREQANERWNEALAWVAQSRPQEALQETLRQAAPQAQESLRQVSAAAREALRHLPRTTTSTDVAAPEIVSIVPAPAARQSNRRVNATLWAVGVGVGLVAAGAVAYIVLRNRLAATSDNDALVEIPLTAVTPTEEMTTAQAAAVAMASEGPAIVEEPHAEEPGVAETPTFDERDTEDAPFIGNILSRVYHPAGSKRLPAPQHRIYFATQEEAEEAGYRPDNAELASRSPETADQQ